MSFSDKKTMCQHLVEQCITEIYSLKSFGKAFCLLIESQFVMFLCQKGFNALYYIHLRVTSGKSLCMRWEQIINLSMFHCISI
jgi:hypothetical protein